jgi:hypothetical protein
MRLVLLVALTAAVAFSQSPPYLDTQGGRGGYPLATERVNEARLYDFYSRQADYYMANPEALTEVLPAYPGLDGGTHGHWGKHNQNQHNDGRSNAIEFGEMVTQFFRADKLNVLKGICLRLGAEREMSVCFDPQTLQYRAPWTGGLYESPGFVRPGFQSAVFDLMAC